MYFEHFGLTQPPFKIVPNHEFYYSGGSRADILNKLVYAISCNDGLFIKIVGEPGTGKTMLAHMLEINQPAELEIYKIPGLSFQKSETPWVIAAAMGLNLGKLNYERAVLVLQQHLVRKQRQGRKVSLFIDEAQTLTTAAMDEIYRFASPENEPFKAMQVVMFGQPELDSLLNQPQLRHLKDQVTHAFTLKHLDLEETGDYLLFRMRTAGYRGPQVFSRKSLKLIYMASKGSIRRINILADKALLAAYLANKHLVDREQVEVALRESWFEPSKAGFLPRIYLALFLFSVLLTAALWLLKWQVGNTRLVAEIPAAASSPKPFVPPSVPDTKEEAKAEQQLPSVPLAVMVSSVQTEVVESLPSAVKESTMVAGKRGADKVEKARGDILIPASAKKKPAVAYDVGGSNKNGEEKMISFPPPTGISVGGENALQIRLEKSLEWLRKQDDGHFTVQLAIASPEHAIAEMQRINAKSQIKPDQLAAYRTFVDGKPTISIVSGIYPTMREAREAVASLPPLLLEYSPLIRSFRGIRTEINK